LTGDSPGSQNCIPHLPALCRLHANTGRIAVVYYEWVVSDWGSKLPPGAATPIRMPTRMALSSGRGVYGSTVAALQRLSIRSYATVRQPAVDASASLGAQKAEASGSSAILRTYKPRTPGVRHLKRPINDHLWRGRAFLPLTIPKKGIGKGGRNSTGRITVRHRGGGAKRRIRTVDFERKRPGPHIVDRIEYDPGRSAHIALVTEKATGRKTYIIAADGLRAGDVVHSYRAGIPQDLLKSMGGVIDPGILAAKTAFKGNCLPLHMIPVGQSVFCIGSKPKYGAVFCRSAGTSAVIVNKNEEMKDDGTKVMTGNYVEIRLQSGEVRRISKNAAATIGVASNIHHHYRQLGKAGRKRWMGIRPTVRGLAMNKVDHPHGGGRGKSKSNRHPVTPWGKPTKSGYKTRPRKRVNRWVVTPRPRNHGMRRNKKVAKKE
jgi:ribosomal protein L2